MLSYDVAHGGTVLVFCRKSALRSQCGGGVGAGTSWVVSHRSH